MYHDYDMQKILEHLRSDKPKNFILDTDTYNEIDDQFAVTYAMLTEKLNILAFSAAPFENNHCDDAGKGMEMSYEELVRVKEFVDPENKKNIPCFRGSDRYMKNVISPVKSEAAEKISEIVHKSDDIVYIAAIGCFTNVASALLLDPSIADKAVIILLGGSTLETGSSFDYNVMQNISAAKVILECGIPVILIPALGGCADTLYMSNAEAEFYLKGKAGKIGDLLCKNFENEEGGPFKEDNVCNCVHRSIFDIAVVALFRDPSFSEIEIVPAHSMDYNMRWVNLNEDRKMIYVKTVNRNKIISDFFTAVAQADLK